MHHDSVLLLCHEIKFYVYDYCITICPNSFTNLLRVNQEIHTSVHSYFEFILNLKKTNFSKFIIYCIKHDLKFALDKISNSHFEIDHLLYSCYIGNLNVLRTLLQDVRFGFQEEYMGNKYVIKNHDSKKISYARLLKYAIENENFTVIEFILDTWKNKIKTFKILSCIFLAIGHDKIEILECFLKIPYMFEILVLEYSEIAEYFIKKNMIDMGKVVNVFKFREIAKIFNLSFYEKDWRSFNTLLTFVTDNTVLKFLNKILTPPFHFFKIGRIKLIYHHLSVYYAIYRILLTRPYLKVYVIYLMKFKKYRF